MLYDIHLHTNGGSSEGVANSPPPPSQALADAVKLMKETLQSAREIQSVIAQVRQPYCVYDIHMLCGLSTL